MLLPLIQHMHQGTNRTDAVKVRKYVRKLGPCTDPEQSEAPDPPDKVNWRRPGGGRVPHRSQERNTPKQHAKKRSPSAPFLLCMVIILGNSVAIFTADSTVQL